MVSKPANMPPKPKQFALVKWVEEDSVGVMPLTAVRKGQMAPLNVTVDMRYQEILMISGELLNT